MTIEQIKEVIYNAQTIAETIVVDGNYSAAYRSIYQALGLLSSYEDYKSRNLGRSYLEFLRHIASDAYLTSTIRNDQMLESYLELI